MQYQHDIAFPREEDCQQFVAQCWQQLEYDHTEHLTLEFLGPVETHLGYMAHYSSPRRLNDEEILEALHAQGAIEIMFDEAIPVSDEDEAEWDVRDDVYVAMRRRVLFGQHRGYGGESL
jgi:hypothetical protein